MHYQNYTFSKNVKRGEGIDIIMIKSDINIELECYSNPILIAGLIGGLHFGTFAEIITGDALVAFIGASIGSTAAIIAEIGLGYGSFGPIISAILL